MYVCLCVRAYASMYTIHVYKFHLYMISVCMYIYICKYNIILIYIVIYVRIYLSKEVSYRNSELRIVTVNSR